MDILRWDFKPIIIVLLTLLIIYLSYLPRYEGFNSSLEMPSPLDADISNGNPVSWSHRENPYIDLTLKGRRRPVIAQGFGFPLEHEEHATAPVEKSMFYFDNYACRPECCLTSSYSCSNGCVCWTPPQEPKNPIRLNEKITPSS